MKEAAAQRAKTIAQLIDESLDRYGIKPREPARALLRRAWARRTLRQPQVPAQEALATERQAWRQGK